MTTPNIEELITYLRSFFIDENVSAIKANQIANALQSQAERIKELEAENGKLSDLWSAMKAKRDELREKYTDTYWALDDAARENTSLRAQLAVCRALAESEDDMELTDAQILTLWEETYVQRGWTGIEFARAIERAHGIGVNQ